MKQKLFNYLIVALLIPCIESEYILRQFFDDWRKYLFVIFYFNIMLSCILFLQLNHNIGGSRLIIKTNLHRLAFVTYLFLMIISWGYGGMSVGVGLNPMFRVILLIITSFLCVYLVTGSGRSRLCVNDFASAFVCSIVLTILLNIFLSLLGFENYLFTKDSLEESTSIMLFNIFNIEVNRFSFPLASGGSSEIGLLTGLGFVINLMEKRKLLKTFYFIVLSFGVIISDSRIALVALVVVCLVIIIIPRKQVFEGLSILLFSLGSFLAFGLVKYFSSILLIMFSLLGLQRSPEEIFTLNNRIYIWDSIIDYLCKLNWQNIIGYGAYGLYTEGISESFAYAIAGGYDREILLHYPAHSLVLQYLVSIGYIGTLMFLIVIHKMFGIFNVSVITMREKRILGGTILYLSIISVSEHAIWPLLPSLLVSFVFVNLLVIFNKNNKLVGFK